MNIRDETTFGSKACSTKLIYLYYLNMYRNVFEASQEEILRRYFELSTQKNISEIESEEFDFILELTYHSQKLTVLTQVIDQHIDEALGDFDESYLKEVERSRINSLDKVLGSSVAHKDSRPVARCSLSAIDIPNLRTLFRTVFSAAASKGVNALASNFRCLFRNNYCKVVNPVSLQLSRKFLLYLSLAVAGYFCSSYKEDIMDISRRLLFGNMPVSEITPASASGIGTESTAVKVNEESHPDECQPESVGWIDQNLDGEYTSYGEEFRNEDYTAAHAFLPPGSKIYLKSEEASRLVVVEVNERHDNLQVSYAAADGLGVVEEGIAPVTVKRVEVNDKEVDELNDSQRSQLSEFQNACGFLLIASR